MAHRLDKYKVSNLQMSIVNGRKCYTIDVDYEPTRNLEQLLIKDDRMDEYRLNYIHDFVYLKDKNEWHSMRSYSDKEKIPNDEIVFNGSECVIIGGNLKEFIARIYQMELMK